jgi:hypothetical protein
LVVNGEKAEIDVAGGKTVLGAKLPDGFKIKIDENGQVVFKPRPGAWDIEALKWAGVTEEQLNEFALPVVVDASGVTEIAYSVRNVKFEKGGTPMWDAVINRPVIKDDKELDLPMTDPATNESYQLTQFQKDAIRLRTPFYNTNQANIHVIRLLRDLHFWDGDADAAPGPALTRAMRMSSEQRRDELMRLMENISPSIDDGKLSEGSPIKYEKFVWKLSDIMLIAKSGFMVIDREGEKTEGAYLGLKEPVSVHDGPGQLDLMANGPLRDLLGDADPKYHKLPSHFTPVTAAMILFIAGSLINARDYWYPNNWGLPPQVIGQTEAGEPILEDKEPLAVGRVRLNREKILSFIEENDADRYRAFLGDDNRVLPTQVPKILNLYTGLLVYEIYRRGWQIVVQDQGTGSHGIDVNGTRVKFHVAPALGATNPASLETLNGILQQKFGVTIDAIPNGGDFEHSAPPRGPPSDGIPGLSSFWYDAWRLLENRLLDFENPIGPSIIRTRTAVAVLVVAAGGALSVLPSAFHLSTTQLLMMGIPMLMGVMVFRPRSNRLVDANDAASIPRLESMLSNGLVGAFGADALSINRAGTMADGLSLPMPESLDLNAMTEMSPSIIARMASEIHAPFTGTTDFDHRDLVARVTGPIVVRHIRQVRSVLERGSENNADVLDRLARLFGVRAAIESSNPEAYASLLAALSYGAGVKRGDAFDHYRGIIADSASRYETNTTAMASNRTAARTAANAYHSWQDLLDAEQKSASSPEVSEVFRRRLLEIRDQLQASMRVTNYDAPGRIVWLAAPASLDAEKVKNDLFDMLNKHGALGEGENRLTPSALKRAVEIHATDVADPFALAGQLKTKGRGDVSLNAFPILLENWDFTNAEAFAQLDAGVAKRILIEYLDLETGNIVPLQGQIQAALNALVAA